MAWYDEAVFYHIYPLGLTGAPKQNTYGEPQHRLNTLLPWIDHIREIGCNAIYIGPLFESVGHGYETTDYKKLDSRLGTNEDLTAFVDACHQKGIRVILDGVFNHTGRDFFAFQDVRQNRENSVYRDWYCNVNFWGNNEYNDGFSYDNWGGYNLLAKLNQKNPQVQGYICDVIRFWVSEFHIDGIRLDAADVLDFEFMKMLRRVANEVKPDFWLMGEVIHGEYSRWANQDTLHAVTNYHLHKALFSGHNDHNYFEIAHTVKRLYGMGGNRPDGLKLYNFVDNHDVERIYTKLNNKAHFVPAHILMYTLPGVPSIYYGSEFGIEGRKERGSDDSLRPALDLADFGNAVKDNLCTATVSRLGKARQQIKALSYGQYNELRLTTQQYAFSRDLDGERVIITVNNADNSVWMNVPAGSTSCYTGILSGRKAAVENGSLNVELPANDGEIWISEELSRQIDLDLCVAEAILAEEPAEMTETNNRNKLNTIRTDEVWNAVTEERMAVEMAAIKEEISQAALPDDPKEAEPREAEFREAEPREAEPSKTETPVKTECAEKKTDPLPEPPVLPENDREAERMNTPIPEGKAYEEMTVEELQQVIYEKMKKNGPVTDRMYRDIIENVYHNSLVNWAKSFR